VRAIRDQQFLSYPLRLPDEIQADALRLLDTSREVINLTVTALWDRLDEFALRTNSYAYKQVEEMTAPPLTAIVNGGAKRNKRAASCADKPSASSNSRSFSPCSNKG